MLSKEVDAQIDPGDINRIGTDIGIVDAYERHLPRRVSFRHVAAYQIAAVAVIVTCHPAVVELGDQSDSLAQGDGGFEVETSFISHGSITPDGRSEKVECHAVAGEVIVVETVEMPV